MTFPLPADSEMDDLPRTLRREKEARLREARDREAQASGLVAPQPESMAYSSARPDAYAQSAEVASPATVKRLDIPFFHLMGFFIKAVFAAIPALILLIAFLWAFGQALETFFPELLKMKILISFPNS